MKKITNKEYEKYQRYKIDCLYGRVLTPEGMRFIIESYNFDAERIGQHFLDMYSKVLGWTEKKNYWSYW